MNLLKQISPLNDSFDNNANPILYGIRIRLARNLTKFPFPIKASLAQKRKIRAQCFEVLKAMPQFQNGLFFNLEELPSIECALLQERHFISPDLCNNYHGAGVAISNDLHCAIMINEEDHLRLQWLCKAFAFEKAWKLFGKIDDALSQQFEFAFQLPYGYLTSCPTNIGTGMRVSAMLHLPGLVMSENMEALIRILTKNNINVRGLFGEGSDASGSLFQLSNQHTYNQDETELITHLEEVLKMVLDQEKNIRKKLFNEQRLVVLDKIGRAYGILRQAYQLNTEETMGLLSLMRLAIDLNLLPAATKSYIDQLFTEIQPAHLQTRLQAVVDEKDCNKIRAEFLRKEFANFPSLLLD